MYSSTLTLLAGHYNQKVHSTHGKGLGRDEEERRTEEKANSKNKKLQKKN